MLGTFTNIAIVLFTKLHELIGSCKNFFNFPQFFGVMAMVPFVNRLGRRGALMLSMAVGFVGIYSLATYSYFYDKSLISDPMYPTSAPNDTLRDSSDYVPRLQQSG